MHDSSPVTGRCHCGSVSYTAQGKKHFEFLCYCTDCRRLNGGGHLAAVMFSKKHFTSNGPTTSYSYQGGSGKQLHAHFCSHCGTSLHAFLDAHPEAVAVRAVTLDDPAIFQPQKALYCESAFPWDPPLKKS